MGFPKAQWLTSSSLPAFRSAGHVTPQILMLSRRTSNDAAPCRRDRDGRINDRRGGGRHPRTACARSGRRSSSRRRAIFTSIYRVIGNLTGPGGRDMSSLARRDVLEKTYMPRTVADQFADILVAAGVKGSMPNRGRPGVFAGSEEAGPPAKAAFGTSMPMQIQLR